MWLWGSSWGSGQQHFVDAIDGREVGEALMSPRERSSVLHCDVSLIESTVRVMGIPKLACAAMCLNSSHHKSQYTLPSSFFFFPRKFYLFGAAKKRKKQGRDRRKGTISAEGKGGIEA